MTENDDISVLTEFSRLAEYPRTGVYLLQSGCKELAVESGKALFRIGESKNLLTRMGSHRCRP